MLTKVMNIEVDVKVDTKVECSVNGLSTTLPNVYNAKIFKLTMDYTGFIEHISSFIIMH
jgi:hypothetical protein